MAAFRVSDRSFLILLGSQSLVFAVFLLGANHKPDGSTLEITAGQQEAAADIEIHIGEYDNNQTDKYLLIEN